MATLTPQVPSLTGLNPSFAAASAGGDKVPCSERTWLHVKNGSASPITVTITPTGAVRGQTVASSPVSVPASGERLIGPIAADLYAGAADGLAAISYSASATVTVGAFRI